MKQLVGLRTRPSRDSKTFVFMLDYVDGHGKRRRLSLGHGDRRKAEKQRVQKERELRMGIVAPESMRLSDFVVDSLTKTGDQIRESTREEYNSAMTDFIKVIGNKDYLKVTIEDGEFYRQRCLDRGNRPATVAKKLREIKCVFETAVKRRQIDENPLKYVKSPRVAKGKVRVFKGAECQRLLTTAQEFRSPVPWGLLIHTAIATGMRRAELLNATWRDVSFDEQTIEVCPKQNTAETWEWHVKDADRRTLPLTEELTMLLAEHQSQQPEGHPYIFVPSERYAYIQALRKAGEWVYSDSRLKVLNNFKRDFDAILCRANVKGRTFHDLRRTTLSNWLASGMSEYDVMILAGHASFSTTHEFYLAVRRDLVDRARQSADFWRAPGARPEFQGQAVDNESGKVFNSRDLGHERP